MSKNGLSSLADEHVKGRFRPDSWPNWPKTKTIRIAGLAHPAETSGSINVARDSVYIKSAARRVSVWLTPQLVDFDKNIKIRVNNYYITAPTPSVSIMLEDVRTRGDRLHPFWARADSWLDRARVGR